MAEQKRPTANKQTNGSKIDALYSWLSYDLQKLKKELLEEASKVSALYGEAKADNEKVAKTIKQEIRYSYIQNQNIYDGLSSSLTETIERLDEVAEKLKEIVERERNDSIMAYLQENVASKLDEASARIALVEQIDVALEEMRQKMDDLSAQFDTVGRKILVDEIVSAVPVAENVDYVRIVDEVGDKVLELLSDVLAQHPEKAQPAPVVIDYDKLSDMVVEKLAARNLTVGVPTPVVVETPVANETVEEKEPVYEEVGDELVDAETGMVIRLKRSFTAKMCQSEEDVKQYYSDLKNALLAYKKIRSNISWHGDRFNLGRETVAKMGINGKTLCFYLALDPNDEGKFKSTVYHQKDVGDQRAHESTPFMVKIKSVAAVKKALRLVDALVEKIGAEKEDGVEIVAYAKDFPYVSTKQLLGDGYIKLTKEKKVEFNF